jgi:hypothetical protein
LGETKVAAVTTYRIAAALDARNACIPALSLGRVAAMTDTVENLMLDLVEWLARKERTYQETMGAWRTSCPRLPVWEDATDRGFVEFAFAAGRSLVRPTRAGFEFLKEKRPDCYEQVRQRQRSASGVA